ncbi:hypothetical protein CEXT_688791 [Caerostris extrusa]|uniref:Uncharacterized protein n=1 Tax=Caerostris extrusa TaxID=172846 RepID=A0AAV4PSS7_CAEEX|nr:hypothetical protein CEXT_688791 [Caerostris extrusa]
MQPSDIKITEQKQVLRLIVAMRCFNLTTVVNIQLQIGFSVQGQLVILYPLQDANHPLLENSPELFSKE